MVLAEIYQIPLNWTIQGDSNILRKYGTQITKLVRLDYRESPEQYVPQINMQSFVVGVLDTELKQKFIAPKN